jgi:hypothetical protein
MKPSLAFATRLEGDPVGLSGETTIINGGGAQLPNLSRWGDYSSMSIDPTDDCTFWYTTEYLISNGTFNWSTWIASFSFPGCSGTATPDFSLSATPSSRTVTAGNPTSYSVTATSLNGYNGTVSFSASGNPAGVTVSFSPTSVTPTSSTTMNVTTAANTTPGTYTLTITGTDGTLTHSTNVTLAVNAPATGDFTIAATPSSRSVNRGSSTSYTVTVAGSGGFSGVVSFTLSGLPNRTSSSFTPSTVTGSGSSVLSVKTNRPTATGTYLLTITGTSGSLAHSTPVTLVIN